MSIGLIIAAIALVVIIGLVANSLFIIIQQEVGIVERLGKFNRCANAGMNFKVPLLDLVAGRLSLRIQQLDVSIETKTKDNVFVTIIVAVQYHVLDDKIYEAFYKLSDTSNQVQSFVFDVVRAQVPKMTLDDVFEKKDEIANAVKNELTELMAGFGYGIVKALVTDINPDAKVKAAMNEINEQQRLRMAAQEKGEAEKIIIVKRAEAEAESMRLSGQGIADQRKAIINGLKDSVDGFRQGVPGISAQDVMNLVLIVQYYDTLKEIGANDKTNTILLPHNPNDLKDMTSIMRNSVMTANLTTNAVKNTE